MCILGLIILFVLFAIVDSVWSKRWYKLTNPDYYWYIWDEMRQEVSWLAPDGWHKRKYGNWWDYLCPDGRFWSVGTTVKPNNRIIYTNTTELDFNIWVDPAIKEAQNYTHVIQVDTETGEIDVLD